MNLTLGRLIERFPSLLNLERGSPETPVRALAAPQTAGAEDLIFIGDEKHLHWARTSKARAWVVQKKWLAEAAELNPETLVSSPNSQLALALVGREFFPQKLNKSAFDGKDIHPSAVIDPTAELGAHTLVGPNATIGAGVKIGADSIIGANSTIEAGATIGSRTHIHPQVYIAYLTVIGDECEIHPQTSIGTEGFGYAHDEKGFHHRLIHYGRVVIENRVHIGAGVQIDRGTFADSRIGEGAIIDNHCHFGHNIEIGKGTIITGGALAAGSVKIGSYCVIGGRTSFGGHLSVADHSQFAALSGVNSTVESPGVYGGYPLQPLKNALKTTASLAQLPKMRRQIARLFKHLNIEFNED